MGKKKDAKVGYRDLGSFIPGRWDESADQENKRVCEGLRVFGKGIERECESLARLLESRYSILLADKEQQLLADR